MSTDYERQRIDNDNAADAWMRGYADAHTGRDVNPPEQHVTEYFRGSHRGIEGVQELTCQKWGAGPARWRGNRRW